MVRLHLEPSVRFRGSMCKGRIETTPLPLDDQRFLVAFLLDGTGTAGRARSQINIVLNWFEELQERVPVP